MKFGVYFVDSVKFILKAQKRLDDFNPEKNNKYINILIKKIVDW